jgi:hypothetical protein
MPVNAEREITTLWRNLHAAQDEICKTYYRWRRVALDLAGPGANPRDVAMKAAESIGKEMGKNLLPRLNWLKGEDGFLTDLGRALAGLWAGEGAATKAEKGEKPGEILITCTRDPWPSVAKEYDVPMEEVALTRERIFQSILEDVSLFFNIPLGIEMLKAIPRGHGLYLFRLYKKAS